MRMAEKTAETLESGETRNREATAPLDDVTLTNVVADRKHFLFRKRDREASCRVPFCAWTAGQEGRAGPMWFARHNPLPAAQT